MYIYLPPRRPRAGLLELRAAAVVPPRARGQVLSRAVVSLYIELLNTNCSLIVLIL